MADQVVESQDRLRSYVLALLVVGVAGTGIELLLLGHYEQALQLIPLVLVAAALAIIVWHWIRPSRGSVLALRTITALMILGGIVGIALHYRGSLAFQLEMNPSAAGWTLFKTVMGAQAPPVLAPGLLTQLGLLGLIYTYRHPASTP